MMSLFLLCTLSASAALQFRTVPANMGIFSIIDETTFRFEPYSNFELESMVWYSQEPNDASGSISTSVLTPTGNTYEAPSSSGVVIAYLTSPTSGSCGTQVTWEVTQSEGSSTYDVLTISGSGPMKDNYHPWGNYQTTIKTIVINEGVTTIGKYAFYQWYDAVTSVTIPSTVTTIRDYAFYSCKSLASVTFAEGSQLETIETSAFASCTSLASITIPSTVTTIGDIVFKSCESLASVAFAEGSQLKTIDKSAFICCTSLASMTIPCTVTTIGDGAFSNCISLASVTFAQDSQLEAIGDGTFYKCVSLASVIIPAKVTTIGKEAFYYCNALITFAAGSQLKAIGSKAFYGSNKNKLSYVSPLPATVKSIGDNAFYHYIGDHLYIIVPEGKELTVNGIPYSGTLTDDNKADLISYLFTNPSNRGSSNALTLAMTNNGTYSITTDEYCDAYYLGSDIINSARPEETVVLSWNPENIPAGKYVSGFTFNIEGLTATPNDENCDYTFIMPEHNVTVTSVISDQVEYTIDLTDEDETVQVIPEMVFTLLNSLNGYYCSVPDPDSGQFLWYMDLNLDGTPDLQLAVPIDGDEESDEDHAYDYTVRRLAGADAVTKNYHFSSDYAFHNKYNKIFVKLSESYEEEARPIVDLLFDDTYENTIPDDGTHSVVLFGRTLFRNGDWNTLCLPFTVDLTADDCPLKHEGVEARTLTSATISGSELNLTFSDPVQTLTAGTPYIIKWTSASQDIVSPVFLNVTINPTTQNIVTSNVDFKGTYSPITFEEEDRTLLFLGEENTLYYPQPTPDPDDEYRLICPCINSFRAYFQLKGITAGDVSGVRLFFGDSEATGISLIPSPSPARPLDACYQRDARKGEGSIYTLNGLKLQGKPTKKGLYIRNGRKVVVK